MKIKTQLKLLLAFLILIGCQSQSRVKEYLIKEKDLIPEGLAVDSRTGITYLGSTYKRKIIQISLDGQVSDFISQELDGVWSILGIEVDEERGILWANTAHLNEVMPLLNPESGRDWMTNITAYSIKHKKAIKAFAVNGTTEKMGFNDLTVMADGQVFSTESANNRIYTIHDQQLSLFIQLENYQFPNGITSTPEGDTLFVATRQGVLKINKYTKEYQLIMTTESINAKGIDGLAFYDQYLIGHQGDKVSKFFLNQEMNAIIAFEILDSDDQFDASTTGEAANGYYHYIVNSQLHSAIDWEKNQIKPMDELSNIIVRKVKL